MDHPRSAFGAPPRGGNASGPAEPDPRRSLDQVKFSSTTTGAWSLGRSFLRGSLSIVQAFTAVRSGSFRTNDGLSPSFRISAPKA